MPGTSTAGTTCYFDLPRAERPPSSGSETISPFTQPPNDTGVDTSFRSKTNRRTRSDYSTVPKRVHVQAIEEDLPDSLPIIHSDPSQKPGTTPTDGGSESLAASAKRPRNHEDDDFKEPPHVAPSHERKHSLPTSKDSHAYPPRRPRLGHMWERTQSGGVWFEHPKVHSDRKGRSSSSTSKIQTSPSDRLPVRTEQIPLKPPTSAHMSSTKISGSSNIKVETSFKEPDHEREEPRTWNIKRQSQVPKESRKSRRNSLKLKGILSTPRNLIDRMGLSKVAPRVTISSVLEQTPEQRPDSRMADHSTLLKRNYTSEALQRVTAILQDAKQNSSNSVWSPVLKPLKLRVQTEKSMCGADRGVQTVQGITGQCTMVQRKSQEALSDVCSYTSSQINMRMGPQPANTPDEQATYKIKRSPSAETEEFLKVDISIRGGTSYLPSEARRIQTPPLPEETQDGRLKGFFFDYNAPRSEAGDVPVNEECGPGSHDEASRARSTTVTTTKLTRTRTGKSRRFHTADWYDVKLAELDATDEGDPDARRNDSNADCRVFSPAAFSQHQKGGEEEKFDFTIPEHLPSSPLCPSHPRYWRVVKGRGSQFRGCWMHGIGEYDAIPAIR